MINNRTVQNLFDVDVYRASAILRDRNGDHEVNLIAELDAHQLIAIEIKTTAALRLDSARHLIWLRDQLGERFVAGVVLHTGPRAFPLDDRIIAAPVATLWS